MAAHKGHEKAGGRKAGTPNKATLNAREAIAKFVDDNAPRLQAWLDSIAAEEGSLVAFNCVRDLLEYHVPKLQRTDIHADMAVKSEMLIKVGFVKGTEDDSAS